MKNLAVILPIFNEEKYIKRVLNSLEEAGIKNVYIDDACSTDNTLKIIKEYKGYLNINLFENEIQLPIFDSLFKMIKRVKEDYIYFIGADDILENKFIPSDLIDNYLINEYYIPIIKCFSEKENKILKLMPPEDFIKSINQSQNKKDIIKTLIDYASCDLMVLGIHRSKEFLNVMKFAKWETLEGEGFWFLLSILLNRGKNINILKSENHGLIKYFEHKYQTGTQHPETKRYKNDSIYEKINRLKNSIINTFIFAKKYKLDLSSILLLLFCTRGKESYKYGYSKFKGPLLKIFE
tara:strand:- start:533 stop:1414 length:882 start_codon:yes stop_codon:yes gene_type:complete